MNAVTRPDLTKGFPSSCSIRHPFSSARGTVTKTDMLGHTTSRNTLERTEIQNVFSDHDRIQLEINNKMTVV